MLIIGGFFGLVVCLAASAVDVREYRIPNQLVAVGVSAMLVVVTVAALIEGSWRPMLYGLAGGIAFFVAYLLLALISPTGMGMGDVKLALVVGLTLGPLGLTASLIGFYAAFVAGAIFGLGRLLVQRRGLDSHLPFAPFMTIGAVVGLAWAVVAG